MKMFCKTCGLEIKDGDLFCRNCGTKMTVPSAHVNAEPAHDNQTPAKSIPSTGQKINTVTVKGGRYIGKKWFIKIPYKFYETDVEFTNQYMTLSQGTGTVKSGPKATAQIFYNKIYSVDTKKKYSIPNVVFACIIALLAIITQIWALLIIILVVLFIGKTAVVSIHHSNGIYEVPTEFFSEAEELRNKINAAIGQARG